MVCRTADRADSTTGAGPSVENAPLEHRCSLSRLLRSFAGEGAAASVLEDRYFPVRRVPGGTALVHEEGTFRNLFFVQSGTFKFARCDEEGYEQVLGFAVRGDMIGMDGIATGRYTTSVIALEDSGAAVVAFSELRCLEADVPAMQSFLHRCASREVRRGLDALQLVCAVGADVRLARFLLQMSERNALIGHSGRRFVLRMSRRDIASYLGLAHETVSRAFTALAHGGYLNVSQRAIEIVDIEGLQSFQRPTRRPAELDAPRPLPGMATDIADVASPSALGACAVA